MSSLFDFDNSQDLVFAAKTAGKQIISAKHEALTKLGAFLFLAHSDQEFALRCQMFDNDITAIANRRLATVSDSKGKLVRALHAEWTMRHASCKCAAMDTNHMKPFKNPNKIDPNMLPNKTSPFKKDPYRETEPHVPHTGPDKKMPGSNPEPKDHPNTDKDKGDLIENPHHPHEKMDWPKSVHTYESSKIAKDYDGDGKQESDAKEHAGVVHNAIQKEKGGVADGQDTTKIEASVDDSLKGTSSSSDSPLNEAEAVSNPAWSRKTKAVESSKSDQKDCDHSMPDPITGRPSKASEWGYKFCPKCNVKIEKESSIKEADALNSCPSCSGSGCSECSGGNSAPMNTSSDSEAANNMNTVPSMTASRTANRFNTYKGVEASSLIDEHQSFIDHHHEQIMKPGHPVQSDSGEFLEDPAIEQRNKDHFTAAGAHIKVIKAIQSGKSKNKIDFLSTRAKMTSQRAGTFPGQHGGIITTPPDTQMSDTEYQGMTQASRIKAAMMGMNVEPGDPNRPLTPEEKERSDAQKAEKAKQDTSQEAQEKKTNAFQAEQVERERVKGRPEFLRDKESSRIAHEGQNTDDFPSMIKHMTDDHGIEPLKGQSYESDTNPKTIKVYHEQDHKHMTAGIKSSSSSCDCGEDSISNFNGKPLCLPGMGCQTGAQSGNCPGCGQSFHGFNVCPGGNCQSNPEQELMLKTIMKLKNEIKELMGNGNGESLETIMRHDKGHDDWHRSMGQEPCSSEEDCAAKTKEHESMEHTAGQWGPTPGGDKNCIGMRKGRDKCVGELSQNGYPNKTDGGSQCKQCENYDRSRSSSKKKDKKEDHYKYIKKQGDSWVITQKGTGKVLSHHDSKEAAISSFKAMMANKHGSKIAHDHPDHENEDNDFDHGHDENGDYTKGNGSITGLHLQLSGEDGNAFGILGRAQKALRRANLHNEHWNNYHTEATSGDYNKLLATTMKYFDVD